ncbi:MAG: HAMP domain-containing histidine kinase [Cyclobacteriaceae bacterium]|nr:HAMP domain-containing histidine kinase [Cyclobacteriaceae bacterium]
MENGGVLRVSFRRSNDKTTICFSDTGVGISNENLSKITNPFFTTKPPGKGTGLGLSIVYSIVAEHGGFISFDSIEGKGTTVTIELPLLE